MAASAHEPPSVTGKWGSPCPAYTPSGNFGSCSVSWGEMASWCDQLICRLSQGCVLEIEAEEGVGLSVQGSWVVRVR